MKRITNIKRICEDVLDDIDEIRSEAEEESQTNTIL